MEEEEEADEDLDTKTPTVCDDFGVLQKTGSRSSLASEAALDLALVQGMTSLSAKPLIDTMDPEATPAPFPGKTEFCILIIVQVGSEEKAKSLEARKLYAVLLFLL